MNIFVLDENPKVAATMLCDSHCSKMILETAQLLCSVYDKGEAPYKRAYYNHPCSRWVRESSSNFNWLIEYGLAIGKEFVRRRPTSWHKSIDVITWCDKNPPNLSYKLLTDHPQCMPNEYKVIGDPVKAYRNYYINEKSKIAKWEWDPNSKPDWWIV